MPIYVTHLYDETEVLNKRDMFINTRYKDVPEMDASRLCDGMNGFITQSDIVDDYREVLAEFLRHKDYKRYYKTIKKMAKRCIQFLEEQEPTENIIEF